MPTEVHFLSERNVLFFTYNNPLSISDIEASLEAYFPLLDETTTTIYSIFDVSGLTLLPPKVMSAFMVKRLAYGPLLGHPRLGLSLVVIGDSRIGPVAFVAAHLFSTKRVCVVHTLDEAWAEITTAQHLVPGRGA